MQLILTLLLLFGVLIFDKIAALPNPAISRTHPHSSNTLQSLIKPKPTEINALQEANYGPIEPNLDIKTTLEQVQNMLSKDPTLPRLTRGEIEDLFEQVTKEEYEKSIKAGDYSRAKHMRALMLVLPFNTESISNDSLQELYNRPPVTKVIPSPEPKPQKTQKTVIPSGKVEIVAIDNPNLTPTTYKPAFRRKALRKKSSVNLPTTYRPNPEIMKTATTPAPKDIEKLLLSELTTPPPFQKLPGLKSTNTRYSSHYNAKKTDFTKSSFAHKRGTTKFSMDQWQPKFGTVLTTSTTTTTTTTSKPKITPELEDILESLGFAAKSQSKKRFKLEDPTLDEDPLPVMSSLIKQDPLGVEEFKPLPINLSADDFKKSLVPQTKPDDFVAFKPLPIPDDTPEGLKPELENYFKMFGLLPANPSGSDDSDGNTDTSNGNRSQKSLKISLSQNNAPIDTTTEKPTTKSIKAKRTKQNNKSSIKRIDTNIDDSVDADNNQQHRSDEEDYFQLLKLLKNLRELQELNISLTEDKLKKLDVKNYNLSETLLSQVGPDPLTESDPNDPLKNEIKRQNPSTSTNLTTDEPIRYSLELDVQADDAMETAPTINPSASVDSVPSTTSATSTSRSSVTTTATTTTTKTSRTDTDGNLADSFSGGLDPVTEEQLPPPRRNGFYFLADWNSFLEVGDGDEQVVVRFSPKVGDPSRFIPVK